MNKEKQYIHVKSEVIFTKEAYMIEKIFCSIRIY